MLLDLTISFPSQVCASSSKWRWNAIGPLRNELPRLPRRSRRSGRWPWQAAEVRDSSSITSCERQWQQRMKEFIAKHAGSTTNR